MRTLQLRHLERRSPIHRVRAEAKIVAVIAVSSAVAFDPGWATLAATWALVGVAFLFARLPAGVLAPPPWPVLVTVGIAGLFSVLSGGDPVVGGVGLGGLLEFAQLVTLGFLLVTLAALLAWTTTPTEIAVGLARLLRPLGRLGLPADEVATAVALAVRTLPAVADEVSAVMDARRTRPAPQRRRRRPVFAAELVDVGVTVVVGVHRRAHDLGRAMVARNSTSAPRPPGRPIHRRDAVMVLVALVAAAAILVVP